MSWAATSGSACGDAPADGLCTKLDCPLSAMTLDSCSFVFGHSPPCCTPEGLAPFADGLPLVAAPGDDDDEDNEGVRIDACDTGDNELGGLARSAWKSTPLLPLVRKLRFSNHTLSRLQYSYFKLFRHRLTTVITRRQTQCPTTLLIDVSRTLDRKCCVVSNPLHRGVQILILLHQNLLAAVVHKVKCIIAVSL